MPNPTISIVTTVYDAKDYIPRTVRSILAQSFTDFVAGGGWQPQRLRRAV